VGGDSAREGVTPDKTQRSPTREPSDSKYMREILAQFQKQSIPTRGPSNSHPSRVILSTDPASSLLKAALVDAPKVLRPLFGVPVRMVDSNAVSCSFDFPQQVTMLIPNR
jgi:hypothetical protein